jgi:hypothetical protein
MRYYLDQVFAVAAAQGIDPSDLTETLLHRAFCLAEGKWGAELATSVDQVQEEYRHLKDIEERQYTGAKYDKDLDILEIKRQVKEKIKNLRVKASVRTKRWPAILSIDIKSYSGQVGGPLLDGRGKLTDLAYQLHDDIEQIANAYNYDHSDPWSDYSHNNFFLRITVLGIPVPLKKFRKEEK